MQTPPFPTPTRNSWMTFTPPRAITEGEVVDAGDVRPSKRRGQAHVQLGNEILIHGGESSTEYHSDCFIYSSGHWRQVEFTHAEADLKVVDGSADRPELLQPRAFHSAVFIGGVIFFFGGWFVNRAVGAVTKRAMFRSVAELSLRAPHTLRLIEPSSPPENSPCARGGHAAICLRNEMWVFGGENEAGEVLNDCFVFSPHTQAWRQVFYSGTEVPGGRYFHKVAQVDEESFLLYGGRTSTVVYSDAWIFNTVTATWKELRVEAETGLPTARAGHSLTALLSCKNRFLVYGGWDGSKDMTGAETGALGDLALVQISATTCLFRRIDIPGSDQVLPRDCHSADLLDDGYLVLFGGCDPDFQYLSHTNVAKIRGKVMPSSLTQIGCDYLLDNIETMFPSAPELDSFLARLPTELADRIYRDMHLMCAYDKEIERKHVEKSRILALQLRTIGVVLDKIALSMETANTERKAALATIATRAEKEQRRFAQEAKDIEALINGTDIENTKKRKRQQLFEEFGFTLAKRSRTADWPV